MVTPPIHRLIGLRPVEAGVGTCTFSTPASPWLVLGANAGMHVHMDIRVDDLSSPEIIQLLREHLRSVALHSPPESIHALDLEGLRKPEVTFWSVWQNTELMGCGALKELDSRHGEIKSMRTVSLHLRKGVASRLMRHILEEARRRSYQRLSLETGSMEAFAPARSLYASFGFEPCGPFADYVEDPYSVFMTREV
jgi:putative acetyltransferase